MQLHILFILTDSSTTCAVRGSDASLYPELPIIETLIRKQDTCTSAEHFIKA